MFRAFLLATFLAVGVGGPASAAPEDCMGFLELEDYLDRAFAEARIESGLLENGNPVYLFVSRAGSWTLVESVPDGQACVHASGTHWQPRRGADTARRSAT